MLALEELRVLSSRGKRARIAAILFFALGLKAYWDHSGWAAFLILAGTIAAACLAASWLNRRLA